MTFQGFSDLPGFTPGATLDGGFNGFGSPNTSDNDYNTLLLFGRYSNENSTPATFSWSGMTPGNTYLIQLWVNDGRNIGESPFGNPYGWDQCFGPFDILDPTGAGRGSMLSALLRRTVPGRKL